MTINREDGRQVDALYRIMCAELVKATDHGGTTIPPLDVLTMATNMVTDYRVRVLEPAFGLLPSPEVQTAVKAEAPRPFTRAAYDAVEASRQPKITKDMVERPANPEPVAKGHADAGTAYRRRRIGQVAPGYTHTDAYAFSRARKAELEESKGRLITVGGLTRQDRGKHVAVTLSDGHTVAGTLTRVEYLTQVTYRLHLENSTYSKEPASGRGARRVKVNTDRPVRVSDR